MFIVWSFVHNYFNSVQWQITEGNRPYYETSISLWLSFIPYWQILVQIFKSRNTIFIYWLWSKSIKIPELYHAVFIFDFEHIQQINLIFLLLTLNMYLSVEHKIKSTKQLKCTLNNRTVSLKHVATFDMSNST